MWVLLLLEPNRDAETVTVVGQTVHNLSLSPLSFTLEVPGRSLLRYTRFGVSRNLMSRVQVIQLTFTESGEYETKERFHDTLKGFQ